MDRIDRPLEKREAVMVRMRVMGEVDAEVKAE
jgi:hypothetical protein